MNKLITHGSITEKRVGQCDQDKRIYGDVTVTCSIGDIVTAITDTAGEGMLYRIEAFKRIGCDTTDRSNFRHSVNVVPVFSFWGNLPLERRKPKWISFSGIKVIDLLELLKVYSEFGLFIRDESMKMGINTENKED